MNYEGIFKYQIDRVFIGKVDDKIMFLYSINDGESYEVIPESNVTSPKQVIFSSHYRTYDTKVYSQDKVKIICSLKQMVEKEEIESLLMNTKHQYVETVSRPKLQQLKLAIVNKKQKFATSLPKLHELARFSAKIVCDELGFNVAVHPQTSIIDVSKVQNVAVSAVKVKKFQDELEKYIFTSFLIEVSENIVQDQDGRSTCIASCLAFSGIKTTEALSQNSVFVQPDLRMGTVGISREVLKIEYVQQPTEIQKMHILSKVNICS